MEIAGRICQRLAKEKRERVAAFSAMATEPDLSSLWELGGPLIFPKVSGDKLSLWLVPDRGCLRPGYRGILEPDETVCGRVEADSVEVILVPGLAFGWKDGGRLGRGGGFYDRFLSESGGERWGLCFEEQLRDVIPCGERDMRMDVLISCAREIEIEDG